MKFKNSILFFIFLIALGVAFFDFSGRTEFGEGGAIVLMAVGSVILVGLFFFSQSRVERKILDGSYNIWWLVKLNIIFAGILYVLLVILSIISAAIEGGEAGMGVIMIIIHGLYIAPLLIVFLSFFPLALYHKFYSNQKIFLFIFLFAIAILILFSIAKFETCSFGFDYSCIAAKTTNLQDATTNCGKIKDEFARNYCYQESAQKLNDITLCSKISPIGGVKSLCIVKAAKSMNDFNACDSVSDTNLRNECYIGVARKFNSVEGCNKMPLQDNQEKEKRYTCIINLVYNTNNAKLCENVNFEVEGRYLLNSRGDTGPLNKETCYAQFQSR